MSLPVRGAWIEIFSCRLFLPASPRRSPCGERGLKSSGVGLHRQHRQSLPVRGAWIEMLFMPTRIKKHNSRSPCGERGLKYKNGWKVPQISASLPVRGAWIEMRIAIWSRYSVGTSLPVRGAWIEISPVTVLYSVRRCRSPCGERGLKSLIYVSRRRCNSVAPRAGSVD